MEQLSAVLYPRSFPPSHRTCRLLASTSTAVLRVLVNKARHVIVHYRKRSVFLKQALCLSARRKSRCLQLAYMVSSCSLGDDPQVMLKKNINAGDGVYT